MDVVLIGDSKELQSIMDLLKKMSDVKNVSAFDRFSKAQGYFENYLVDLALLDADDEETGWEIPHRKIKEINGATKVALISRNEAAAVKAHEAGVWDYLLKPVKGNQLLRVVRKVKTMICS